LEGALAVRCSFRDPPTLLILGSSLLSAVAISTGWHEGPVDIQCQLRALVTELSLHVVDGRPLAQRAHRAMMAGVLHREALAQIEPLVHDPAVRVLHTVAHRLPVPVACRPAIPSGGEEPCGGSIG